jgi:preprotein translocase subunit SecG
MHVGVCLALILIILLQTGKGAGMGAAFGGASQTVFGSTGRATFLTKVTIAAAVTFGLTSLGLSFIGTSGTGVMDDYTPPAPTMPSVPELPSIPEIPGGVEPNIPGGPPTTVPGTLSPGEETGTVPPPAPGNLPDLFPMPEGEQPSEGGAPPAEQPPPPE